MKKVASVLSIFIIYVVLAFAAPEKNIGTFVTTDLNGKTVTNNIFSKVDVTVLNVWGTYCGPCISEMPELAEWAENMPSNQQIVGLIVDVNSAGDTRGINTAKRILNKAGADFLNIIANVYLYDFLDDVQFVPTTFLIDKNGKVIGEPIIGANVDSYKKAVEKYLNGKKR